MTIDLPGLAALLTAFAAAFAAVGAWLQRRRDRGGEREESEIGRLRQDIAQVKLEAAEARAQHSACEERVEALETRLEAVEQHHQSLMARWIKDANKRLIWVNYWAMRTIFVPLGFSRREDVLNRTFAELGFEMDTVTEVDRLDGAALMREGEAASTLLTLRRADPVTGAMRELPPMVVVKVAGIGRDNELIFEGYAYRGNDKEAVLDAGERRQAEQRGASALRLEGERGEGDDPTEGRE